MLCPKTLILSIEKYRTLTAHIRCLKNNMYTGLNILSDYIIYVPNIKYVLVCTIIILNNPDQCGGLFKVP